MTIVRVWDSNDTQHYLDLYPDYPVKLNFEFRDARSFDKSATEHSFSFRVPATETNCAIFGDFFNPNSDFFNPKLKSRAEISHNTIPLLTGSLKMTAAYNQKGDVADFECTVFGEVADLIKSLGDQKLNQLTDISGINHVIDYDNYAASLAGTLVSGNIIYALIDKGHKFSDLGEPGARPVTDSNYPIFPSEFTPCVKLKWVIDEIFSDAGFTYDSTFFESSFFDKLVIPWTNGSKYTLSDEQAQAEWFNVGATSDSSGVNVLAGDYLFVDNQSESGDFFDTGSNYTTVGGSPFGYYTAPFAQDITFKTWFTVKRVGGNANVFARPMIYDVTNGAIKVQGDMVVIGTTFATYSNDFVINVEANVDYAFGLHIVASDGSADVYFQSSATPDEANGTGWKITASGTPFFGQTFSGFNNAPDFKQIDLLTSVSRMFNLVSIYDRDTQKIVIEPYSDYIQSGSTIDWTQKIDTASDIVIKSTADDAFKEYKFTYTDDADVLNKIVKAQGGRTYGEFKYTDSGNDWATQNLEVRSLTSSTPLNAINGTNILIPKLVDDKGEGIKPNCRILYYGGEVTTANQIQVYDDDAFGPVANYHHHFGHYSVPIPGVADIDLNYGHETPFQEMGTNPVDNLFLTYWRGYMNDMFSFQARIMNAKFYLTIADIESFSFGDKIWVKNCLWRINKISNYSYSDELTDVELVKLVDLQPFCDVVPVDQNPGGQIIWQDLDGNTVAGTEECCNKYGWTWTDALGCIDQTGKNVAPQTNTGIGGQNNGNQFNQVSGAGHVIAQNTGGNIIGGFLNEVNHQYGLIWGLNNYTPDKEAIEVGGKNALVWSEGQHFGGGFMHQRSSPQGLCQVGTMVLQGYGDISGIADEVDLYLMGQLDNHITMPDDTCIGAVIYCVFSEISPSTNNIVGVFDHEWRAIMYKTGGIAYVLAGYETPHHTAGSYTGIDLLIDTATDTTEHQIRLVGATGTRPTFPVKVSMRIDYTQVGAP